MAVAYVLEPPTIPNTVFLPVTLVLSGRTLVRKGRLIPEWKEFASADDARARLDEVIRTHERAGYSLVETSEVDEEIAPEEIGSVLTVAVDAATKRMTVISHNRDESPSAEMLDTIAARLRKHEPRCLHVAPDLRWRRPQLAKVLIPSLESFIFDYDTIARQSDNTLGDISDVLEACPSLKRAFITGCSTMRTMRHEHLRELFLMGNPLHSSVMPALVASQLPGLETLALRQEEFSAADLAGSLRSIEAPRLSHVYVAGAPVLELLAAVGTAELPWSLGIIDPMFDDVDGLWEVLEKHDALRSGKVRLHSETFFDDELERLVEMGVMVEDMSDIFAYSDW
jgi:hypothetical protein